MPESIILDLSNIVNRTNSYIFDQNTIPLITPRPPSLYNFKYYYSFEDSITYKVVWIELMDNIDMYATYNFVNLFNLEGAILIGSNTRYKGTIIIDLKIKSDLDIDIDKMKYPIYFPNWYNEEEIKLEYKRNICSNGSKYDDNIYHYWYSKQYNSNKIDSSYCIVDNKKYKYSFRNKNYGYILELIKEYSDIEYIGLGYDKINSNKYEILYYDYRCHTIKSKMINNNRHEYIMNIITSELKGCKIIGIKKVRNVVNTKSYNVI